MKKSHAITSKIDSKSAWKGLMIVSCLVYGGALIGSILYMVGYALSTNGTIDDFEITTLSKGAFMGLEAVVSISAFIIAPLSYLYLLAPSSMRKFFQWPKSYMVPLLTTTGLVFACIVVNSIAEAWNMQLLLPDGLESFEVWAQEKEAALQEIIDFLTAFHSLKELGVGILVISIIPAIGEELLFRGVMQPLCHQITRNIHVAISVSAFVFSAIHFQFYTFAPRFLLGVLFGYLYWWTKDLLFPIAAHFFNNTLSLITQFLYQQGTLAQDPSEVQVPSLWVLTTFAIVAVTLARTLQEQARKAYTTNQTTRHLSQER